ncbi:hypothetical protein [Aquamicrobium defluvii]|nr:hypothetical protein [Aquamicrobium defluvii]EZQ16498.1 hypothetical protein CF98_40820 [Halopseudomonas bauzanensis]
MSIHPTLKKPWFRMVLDEPKPEPAPKREVLRDGDTSFGLVEATIAEKRRIRDREKKRRQRARQRNEAGRFVAKAPPLVPAIGEVFETAHGPAYQVDGSYIRGGGMAHTSITLPFVSILAT